MSHVDEGALHAYLDGALDEYPAPEASYIRDHLEACPQCAIRLEAQRRVRQDADSILALAVPDVDVPSFEELRSYVKATRPPPSRMSVRLYRMGWAASVVLAVGVGWMVRDGQVTGVPGLVSEPARAPATGSSLPSLQRADRAASMQEAELAPDDALGDAERRVAEEVASGVAPAAEAFADRSERSVAEVDVLGSGAPTVASADELVARASTLDPSVPVAAEEQLEVPAGAEDVAKAGDPPPDEGRETAVASGVDADSGSPVGTIRVPPVAPVAGATVQNAAPAEPAASDEPAGGRQRSADPVATRLQAGPVPAQLRSAPTGGAAGIAAAGDWLVVPGLEVVSYRNLIEGTVPMGLHIVHRLEDGGILDLYHLPAVMLPSDLPPLGRGRTEVAASRGQEWIVLRAALDTDVLESLLARMEATR